MKIYTEADYLRAHITVLEPRRNVHPSLPAVTVRMAVLLKRWILSTARR